MREKEPRLVPGGDLELAVLRALWKRKGKRPTARDLFEAVGAPRGVVYTTVAKVLDRLVHKGLIKRKRAGRTFVYQACVSRAKTQGAMARAMLERLLGDDPKPAVAALIGALEDLSPAMLEELAAEIESRKGRGHGT